MSVPLRPNWSAKIAHHREYALHLPAEGTLQLKYEFPIAVKRYHRGPEFKCRFPIANWSVVLAAQWQSVFAKRGELNVE